MALLANNTRNFTDVLSNSSPAVLHDTVTSATLTLADLPATFQKISGATFKSEKELAPILVPKFIQAIVTLILCAILISTTLCIIAQLKKLCSNKGRNNLSDDVEVGSPGSSSTFKNNDSVTPSLAPASPTAPAEADFNPTFEDALIIEESSVPNSVRQKTQIHDDKNARRSSSNRKTRASTRASVSQAKAVYLRVPGIQVVRRASSGPFGAETMAFVQETYRKPVKPPPSPELGFSGLSRANHHYN